ncbi:phage major capsid protein [Zoogloea sp.]|uniref:phage major capsid family protein n=1 Tax=Zoogloea sp. TaxID=49181 RepID=UPI0014164A0E|nr:MAG: hypothetical protein F9K15_02390 [Zoogloea sp.]
MKKILTREASVSLPTYSEAERTIEVAFSSEDPYPRPFGLEVLSHNPSDVDLTWINSGRAPLLLGHNTDDQIGVVLSARLDPDRVCRAVVKFSQSEDATEILQDIKDGIRQNISVGYEYYNPRSVEIDGVKCIVCDWMPYEISVVAIPADKTVGVGRSENINKDIAADNLVVTADASWEAANSDVEVAQLDQAVTEEQGQRANPDNKKNKDIKMENQNIDIEAIKAEAKRAADQAASERAADIVAFGMRAGLDASFIDEFTRSGKSLTEFQAAAAVKMADRPRVNTVSTNTVELSRNEVKQFSLLRAIQAASTGNWNNAGFEREYANAVGGDSFGNSVYVPGEYFARALDPNAFTAAGNPAFVNTTKLDSVDVLFNKTIANRLGVTYKAGLKGTYHVPRYDSAPDAVFVDEGQAGTYGAATTSDVELKPRTLLALAQFSYQSTTNMNAVEQDLTRLIIGKVTQKMDQEVFTKILANADIDWTTVPTDFTYLDFVKLIGAVDNANALSDSSRFAASPLVKAKLKGTLKDTNTAGIYLIDSNDTLAGYRVESSGNVGNNLIFGNFENVYVGSFAPLRIDVDPYTNFATGAFGLRAVTSMDVAVIRPQAFAGFKNVPTV